MPSVMYAAECHKLASYAQYAQCRYAECHYAGAIQHIFDCQALPFWEDDVNSLKSNFYIRWLIK